MYLNFVDATPTVTSFMIALCYIIVLYNHQQLKTVETKQPACVRRGDSPALS